MSNSDLKNFALAMLAVDPEIPMSAEDIESAIDTYGFAQFIRNADAHTAELLETAELISSLTKED